MKKIDKDNTILFCQYEVTYACQSKCPFCYNPQRSYSLPSYNVVNRIVEKIKKYEIPHVQLTGGEVTLLPFLNEIIENLSEISAVSIVTNGLKKVKLSESLMCLYISLHGSNANIHESLTNLKGSYEIICQNIKEYVDEGFDVSADVLLTSLNYNDIYNIIERAFKLGMKRVYINRFQLGGIASNSINLLPTFTQFNESVKQILKAKKEFDIDVMFGTAIPFCALLECIPEGREEEIWDLTPFCGAGFWHVTIDPIGRIKLCNQAQYCIGNILSHNLEKVWSNHPVIRRFRNLTWLLSACKNCPAKSICRGGCIVDYTCSSYHPARVDIYLRRKIYSPSKKIFSKIEKTLDSYKPQIKLNWIKMKENKIIYRRRKKLKEVYLVNPSIGVLRLL